jgi:trans-aconitate methyltransferase
MIWIKYRGALDMADNDRKQHWDGVYQRLQEDQVSWYQEKPRLSLSMIAHAELPMDAPIIDIGGGASLLVDHLLAFGYRDLSELDVSRTALDLVAARTASQAAKITFIETDVTHFEPHRRYRLWHDRAAFHFLTCKKDRRSYVRVLDKALVSGGDLVLAAFAPGGPEKCSGLDIVQYDAEKLGAELGQEFELQEWQAETHVTPAGREQLFNFFRYRRL